MARSYPGSLRSSGLLAACFASQRMVRDAPCGALLTMRCYRADAPARADERNGARHKQKRAERWLGSSGAAFKRHRSMGGVSEAREVLADGAAEIARDFHTSFPGAAVLADARRKRGR